MLIIPFFINCSDYHEKCPYLFYICFKAFNMFDTCVFKIFWKSKDGNSVSQTQHRIVSTSSTNVKWLVLGDYDFGSQWWVLTGDYSLLATTSSKLNRVCIGGDLLESIVSCYWLLRISPKIALGALLVLICIYNLVNSICYTIKLLDSFPYLYVINHELCVPVFDFVITLQSDIKHIKPWTI